MKFMKHFKEGVQAIKVWEHLAYIVSQKSVALQL
jgi:hypothetical protein